MQNIGNIIWTQNTLPFCSFVQLKPSYFEQLRGSAQSANIYIPSVPVI